MVTTRWRRAACLAPALAAGILLAGCGGGGGGSSFYGGSVQPLRVGHVRPLTTARPSPPRGPAPIATIEDDRLSYTAGIDVSARMATIASLGAAEVRVQLPWWLIAPTRPKHPENPNDPAYHWQRFDQIVAAARRDHVGVEFTVFGTPSWAASPGVKPFLPGASFAIAPRDPADYGRFAVAAARRYAPRGVLRWEGWNEPNVPLFLTPQFVQHDGSWVNVSAGIYSALQKAFYAGIKAVAPHALVAGLTTAPVGDVPPKGVNSRTEPREFVRLLDAPGLRPPMDVVSHHPYPQKRRPSDVTFPGASYVDLYNLSWLEDTLDQTYLRGKPLWLTEFGYPTEKVANYTFSVTPEQQAEYLSDAYRRSAQDPRIKLFSWYFLQDNVDWKSGLETESGAPKPAFYAFRFPVAPDTIHPVGPGSTVTVYGQARLAKGPTTIDLQVHRGGAWASLRTVRTAADGSFRARVRPARSAEYRAVWPAGGGETSQPFRVAVSRSAPVQDG